MGNEIRALVFKTSKFNATKDFFQNLIGLPLKEESGNHFVIHTKGIRLVFIEASDVDATEFYINIEKASAAMNLAALANSKNNSFSNYIDPNGISVILCHEIDSTK